MDPVVVVGASLAGVRAAAAARRAGWDGDIVVVGDEPHMPYTRPPLSKELLTSPAQDVSHHLLPAAPEATWLLGRRATGLDRAARRLVLADADQLPYHRLIIATGCRPRRWTGPGAELAGLHAIRSVEDAIALRGALTEGATVAIVGAGFVGCEVASSARALGLDVTVFDILPTPMRGLGPLLAERCAALHEAHGVRLRLGVALAGLHGEEGHVRAVDLADGSRHEADVVVIALGAVPCTQWLAGSGLELDGGVRCDPTLTATVDPDVLAAGDIAAWPHPLAGGAPIRIEHWTNAAEQGAVAGRNALVDPGERETYASVPSFWSDQYDVKLQAVGLPHLAERQYVVEESGDGARMVAVGERGGMLVAALGFNAARRLPGYRRRIGSPLDLDEIRTDPQSLGAPARLCA
jgi:3-phenylpropionate/trans-cinnamate dioxygenase ferredoxin reductase component